MDSLLVSRYWGGRIEALLWLLHIIISTFYICSISHKLISYQCPILIKLQL